MKLKYGKRKVQLTLPDRNILHVLNIKEQEILSNPEDIIRRIKNKFVLGGYKAYGIARVVKEVEVILISSLPKEKVRKLFFIPMINLSYAIEYVKGKYGENFLAYILPSGNTVLPQLI